MLHAATLLLLLFSGCNADDAATDFTSLVNVSNSKWCTDVLNPTLDYLLKSSFLRDAILSEPIPNESFSTMGLRISNMQISGVERLERQGNLYALMRSGNILIVQGAIRAVEVSTNFTAKFSFFKPDTIQLVTRGIVIRFGVQVRLETGQRAKLMSLIVADLGRIEVLSTGRLSSMIRKATSNRLTRGRIAKAIGVRIKATLTESFVLYPLL